MLSMMVTMTSRNDRPRRWSFASRRPTLPHFHSPIIQRQSLQVELDSCNGHLGAEQRLLTTEGSCEAHEPTGTVAQSSASACERAHSTFERHPGRKSGRWRAEERATRARKQEGEKLMTRIWPPRGVCGLRVAGGRTRAGKKQWWPTRGFFERLEWGPRDLCKYLKAFGRSSVQNELWAKRQRWRSVSLAEGQPHGASEQKREAKSESGQGSDTLATINFYGRGTPATVAGSSPATSAQWRRLHLARGRAQEACLCPWWWWCTRFAPAG